MFGDVINKTELYFVCRSPNGRHMPNKTESNARNLIATDVKTVVLLI